MSAPAVKSASRPFSVAAGMTVTPRPRRARPVRLAERSAGPRSIDEAGVGADGVGQLARPVDGLDADGVGEVLGQTGVEAAGLGPVAHHRDGRGQGRVVEAEGDGDGLDRRVEGASAAGLGLDLGGLGGSALLDGGAEAAQCVGGAADHGVARAVDDAEGRDVVALGGGVGQLGDLGGGGAADGEHRGLVLAVRHQAGAAAGDGAGGADQAGDREQLDVTVACSRALLPTSGEGGDAEDALAVADGGDRARSRARSRPSAASRSRVAAG